MAVLATYIVPHPPLIIPDVGQGSEKQIQKTIDAYNEIASEISNLKPDTIIFSSPHAPSSFSSFLISSKPCISGSFSSFGASSVDFKYDNDLELVREIKKLSIEKNIPIEDVNEDDYLDHGVMVPLYFIRKKYNDFKIVKIGLSGLSLPRHYQLGMLINKAIYNTKRRVVYIASGDLSHKLQEYGPYGFCNDGPVYDNMIIDICKSMDFGRFLEFDDTFLDSAAECGHSSFTIMTGVLDSLNVESKFYSHEDVTGVGYLINSFIPKNEEKERNFLEKYYQKKVLEIEKKKNIEDPYVKLARETIEEYISTGNTFSNYKSVPIGLKNTKAGAFVSIHENGKLRGCIGTIIPTEESLMDEIIKNAISASTRDPRFPPIRKEELNILEISVDVLLDIEEVESLDELDVKKYGIIVTSGFKRGVLLPNIEGIDDVDTQIKIAKKKADIIDDNYIIQKFEVIRHN